MGNRYTIDEYSEVFKVKDTTIDIVSHVDNNMNNNDNNNGNKELYINTKEKKRQIYILKILCPCISQTN